MHLTDHDFSALHIIQDPAFNFFAVICLHQLGHDFALGGCRFVEYPATVDAVQDAIRLSNAMRYKAAISELKLDGGKAVIVKSAKSTNHEMIFQRFAELVHSLNGKYITTVDSGTTAAEMAIIKKHTPFVIGYSDQPDNQAAYSTALGVLHGIKAAVQIKLAQDTLKNLHIAIQGLGSVGSHLAYLLAEEGVKLTICDTRHEYASLYAKKLKATVVPHESIYDVECDVFSPCALGQIIHPGTVSRFKTKLIAGAANDQLSTENMVEALNNRNILYVPDFVINAGGLIHLAMELRNQSRAHIEAAVIHIGARIGRIFQIARAQNKNLLEIAKAHAEAAWGMNG